MFNNGILYLIEGSKIDRPRNVFTLTLNFHQLFGNFKVYFKAAAGTLHIYKIDTTRSGILRNSIFLLTRTLYLTTTRIIDSPSPRFLAIYRAIILVLHQSAAGDYIDRILKHLDQINVREDGSTEVGHLIELRLGDWLRSIRAC
jgi:HNH endonuclease